MRLLAAAVVLTLTMAAAACGGDKQVVGRFGSQAAELEVVVRPDGRAGPAKRNVIRCGRLGPDSAGSPECSELGDLDTEDLAPVAPDTACAQVYGGPATATVRGTLAGERVNARFSLTDSCEIERWRLGRALLGDPPRRR